MTDIFLFKVLVLLSGGIFFIPKEWKVRYVLLLHAGIALITSMWAIEAWAARAPLVIDVGIPFWGGTPSFEVDKLSSLFLFIINLTALTGIVYGAGYLRPHHERKSDIAMSLHVWAFFALYISMLHVVMMREGFAFLMAWEVMSMSSFILVIFNGEEKVNLNTGIRYLVQMHAGFTFLLLGFLRVSQETGTFGFHGLAPYFHDHSNWGLFVILFAGFAVKAGFVPLHTWLPHAHPAAPSHVSGVMSGVMIKMGIYGIFRILVDVQSDFIVIGVIILAISIVTGISGIIYSSFQSDLKKILAYSSIENIGIIGIGTGLALLGRHLDNPVLTALGLTGALLHVVNHSLYKSLLFYTAGNVYYATHTSDLNKLGGIMQRMPVSGAFFLIGSLSICAIPPFNGFISEFLIYRSVFQTIGTASFNTSLMTLVVVLSLVVIGGLSVFSFSKAFGLSFLGSRRGPNVEVKEVPWSMRLPGFAIVALILAISLCAPWVVMRMAEIGPLFSHLDFRTDVVAGNQSILRSISEVNGVLLIAVAGVYLLRSVFQRKENRLGPTWGCGYPAGDFKHQYTSTSYANYLREFVGPTADIKDEYRPYAEAEIFPGARSFETRTRDLVEEKLVVEPVEKGLRQMEKIGWAQTGRINHYLIYPLAFLLIIMLLTLFGGM